MGDTATHIAATLIGRYTIKGEVARGGMASVYRGHDLRHNRDVAIKILRHELASFVSGERFAREIAITARLRHPNILPLLDSGESDGVPFYVMPFIEGDTLSDRLRREGQLPIGDSVRLIGEVATALAYAHTEGVIHRDIKPSNVLLSDGHALVADFGIARALDGAASERITDSGIALGTAHYMSPEQASGGAVDARSDIYALGCLLYEMLGGAPPFTGPTARSIMARHAVDPMPSLRTLRGTVPAALEDVVRKALSKAPADRYATPIEFKTAVDTAALDTRLEYRRRSATRWTIGAVGAIAVAAFAVWRLGAPSSGALDPNRVMVFPIAVTAGAFASPTIGEDAATLIGSAVDGAGPLRWVDAWPLLPAALRDSARNITQAVQSGLAAAHHSGRYVTGRFLRSGDSTIAILQLWDTDSAIVIAQGKASAVNADVWRLALRAANELLPSLVPGATRELVVGWEDRQPAAIANFLLGESAFRRGQFDEARQRYRDAVRADSLFSLAAIRGAQAATWEHRTGEASAFVQVATRQPLPPRLAHLARGYESYLAGRADSAIAELRAAIAIDPEMSVAWAQLGEVYSHLMPRAGNPDSLADDAFDHALQFDSTAANVLYHPIQIALRRGDRKRASSLRAKFLAVHPDSSLVQNIDVMTQCVEKGVSGVRWTDLARTHPLPLVGAAFQLGAGGAQSACAIAAFRAILAVDTVTSDRNADGRNWGSLIGLHGLLVAEQRPQEAIAAVDAFVARWHYGNSLFLLTGPYDAVVAARAREVARADAQQHGAAYARVPRPLRLWELGRWELREGRTAVAQTIAADLRARAEKSGSAEDMLFARSLEAWVTLARGDTARAVSMLGAIVPAVSPVGIVQWSEMASVPQERLLLAQLLLAKGDAAGALETANVFDSPSPAIYSLFLRASLDVRLAAAKKLGNAQGQSRFQSRIAALR